LIYRKEHLTPEGFHKILAIKASINHGLSSSLKEAFPDITPVPRPTVKLPENIDSYWLSGFTEGDGCFFINIIKSSDYKFGAQVRLRFLISQHSRDTEHMKSLVSYLGCGSYHPSKGRDCGEFVVTGFSDNVEKIIPFFQKYKLHGSKIIILFIMC